MQPLVLTVMSLAGFQLLRICSLVRSNVAGLHDGQSGGVGNFQAAGRQGVPNLQRKESHGINVGLHNREKQAKARTQQSQHFCSAAHKQEGAAQCQSVS